MKKELQNTYCYIKWYNMGTWQKEKEVKNLLDACGRCCIKFRKSKENIILTMNVNEMLVRYISNPTYFTRDVIKLVAIFHQYLGDKTVIETPYRRQTVNF